MKKDTKELLSGIEKRLRFIHIVERILDYSLPENIKIMVPDKGILDNLVVLTLIYIMDRTLGNNQSCSLKDVETFIDDIIEILPDDYEIYADELAKFLVIGALQNNGSIKEYLSFDSTTGKFTKVTIRLIDEIKGEYRLTDDAFDFLFRSKEIESEIDYSVARFKLREHLKRDNYREALDQSKELISRIRSMKQSMDTFERRCREDTGKIAVDEYEKIITKIRALLDDEYKELEEIEEDAKNRADKLSEAYNHGVGNEQILDSRKALSSIISNIDTTISEQRKLINKKESLSEKYSKILEDSFAVKSYDKMNFEKDIMVKVRRLDDRMGDLVSFLFVPLMAPKFDNIFSIENFYNIQDLGVIDEREKGIEIIDAVDISSEELVKARNARNIAITKSFFSYMKKKESFHISDYIADLKVSEVTGFCMDNGLQEYLLSLYKLGEIDVKEWTESEKIIIEPKGELEFNYFLGEVGEHLADVKKICFINTDKIYRFDLERDDGNYHIELTDYIVEVKRG